MPQYNDCMNAALVAQVSQIGATQDMLYEYLLLHGGTAGGLNDLWHQVWDLAGVTSGAFNDRAFEWLGSLGYTDSDLQTRWFTFWCDGGLISTETNLILNSRMCDNTSDGIPESFTIAETDADVVYAKRQVSHTQWAVFAETDTGVGYLQQSVNLDPGNYVASFTVNEMWTVISNYLIGSISGGNLTINTAFPAAVDAPNPGIVSCFFTIDTVISAIALRMGVLGANNGEKRVTVSRPQIIAGTEYKPAETTGVECTGEARELFYDSNHEPVKDVNGDYAYVVS